MPNFYQNTNCNGVLQYDIFTDEFYEDIKSIIDSNIKFDFGDQMKAIFNFYVFPTLCSTGLNAGKMYPSSSSKVLKVSENHQFLPKLSDVDIEINSILPLSKPSEKLRLTFIR